MSFVTAFVTTRYYPVRRTTCLAKQLSITPNLICWGGANNNIMLEALPNLLVSGMDNVVNTTPATSTGDFEPVLDVPALGTFLFILIIFAALNFRTSQVEKVIQERNYWLKQVQNLKSKELAGDASFEESKLQNALKNYEYAVIQEEQLRNLLPGGMVRIVPPSAASEEDEKAAAMAKQFLGKDYEIGVAGSSSKNIQEQREGGGNLPAIALVVLAAIFFLQMGLFIFLGLSDPMTTFGNGNGF